MKRGRNQRRRGNTNVNRAFDSTGPEVKIRGTATQIYDKYQTLARDAASSGDRVRAESLMQHAEHYYRVMKAMQPPPQPEQNDPAEEPQPEMAQNEDEEKASQAPDVSTETTAAEPSAETAPTEEAPEAEKPKRQRRKRAPRKTVTAESAEENASESQETPEPVAEMVAE